MSWKAVFLGLGAATISVSQGLAASKPIQILPGQVINACAKATTGPQIRPAIVCNTNILATGGQVISGYTFTVKPGTTLPRGIFLLALTGEVTLQSKSSTLPARGTFQVVVHDDVGNQASSVVTLLVQPKTAICGCPVFQTSSGALPAAKVGVSYVVTVPIAGPSSLDVLRPNYVWTLRRGSVLPAGLTLDQARGVIRGIPKATAHGPHNFTVNVRETHTGETTSGNYSLQVN
jgi:hypothetical protein